MKQHIVYYNHAGNCFDIIENQPIDKVIELAKTKYNIFVPSSGKLYTDICNRIKARLDREGLSHEIVRPD
jgi:hypothetical protein